MEYDMDLIHWIETNLNPTPCSSTEFFYNEMESQSGFCLPVIYQPFEPRIAWHWGERGALFDFLYATQGEGKRLLDFGPGDGWPSLIVAPYAGEVVGVDGSRKRVEVCAQNAARMGIRNASFVHYQPGARLPFPDASFDGVMAASSIEQAPDPRATLAELFRVLRPGGRLRIRYEGLCRYHGGQENAIELDPAGDQAAWLTLYARDLPGEQARMARIRIALPAQEVLSLLCPGKERVPWEALHPSALARLRDRITETRACTLTHPSGQTYARWMKEAGFSQVLPTHNGIDFAEKLFHHLPEGARPTTLEAVDALLAPPVRVVVDLPAPLEIDGLAADPAITAIK